MQESLRTVRRSKLGRKWIWFPANDVLPVIHAAFERRWSKVSMKSGEIKVVLWPNPFFPLPLGGSLNGSEISHRWSVWEMEHNYCRSVSTNGWLVGNSVMTECAQVGCNTVLNEWCRPRTHPPQCRCRLQQLPSERLMHRDRVFSTRGTKIIIIKKEPCAQNN